MILNLSGWIHNQVPESFLPHTVPWYSMTTAAMVVPQGAEVTSMTMENLTADADALRQALGFEKWAVLGHSFGGYVALEYALRYPQNLSHLLLMDTGAENSWAQEKAPQELAKRGFRPGDRGSLPDVTSMGRLNPRRCFHP